MREGVMQETGPSETLLQAPLDADLRPLQRKAKGTGVPRNSAREESRRLKPAARYTETRSIPKPPARDMKRMPGPWQRFRASCKARLPRCLWGMLVMLAGSDCLTFAQSPAESLPLFVGQERCRSCHASHGSAQPCSLHRISRHAESFTALRRPEAVSIAALSGVVEPPVRSRYCLECHATGAEEGPRWWQATFHAEDGVQCEACHGPGSLHVEHPARTASPYSNRPLIRRGSRQRCTECHQPLPSHREVLERGFRLAPEDEQYKTPVNLAVRPDGRRLYIALERADRVSVVDIPNGRVIREIPVGRRPHGITLDPAGRTVYVTCRLSDEVWAIDAETGDVRWRLPVGRDPHGVVVTRDGKRLFTANTGENTVSVVDVARRKVVKRLIAGQGPWDLALSDDGMRMLVTNIRPNPGVFRAPPVSEITEIDATTAVVARRFSVDGANMLQGVAFVPGTRTALFVLHRTKNLVPITRLQQGWVITNGLGILHEDGRIDQVLLDEPVAAFADPTDIAISADGRKAFVSGGGVDEIAVVDVAALLKFVENGSDESRSEILPNHLGSAHRFVRRRMAVPVNPRGLAFDPVRETLYGAAALADSIFAVDAAGEAVRTIPLGGPDRITPLRRGERLFHSAAVTFGRQFSCRSCHPDGHINGLTFDIEADGLGLHPVDNRSLRGILDTAPFKWNGGNATLARQCGPRLAVFFTRLLPYSSEDLDDLVHYIATIERHPNRYRRRDGLTPAQRRGKMIFERTVDNAGRAIPISERCTFCHAGALKTNRQQVVVDTAMWFDAPLPVPRDLFNADEYGDLGNYVYVDTGTPSVPFDVPQLENLPETAPYLHNGAARTLEEIWTRFNMVNHHGRTGDLTRRQFNDLIAYLKSL
ncbi:MAG: hypothetical protein D6788_06780 [Planctomycetota bacterium]|nr:MAG: hypothetical protein D6788_06780 [Planctomycetota bacterium]